MKVCCRVDSGCRTAKDRRTGLMKNCLSGYRGESPELVSVLLQGKNMTAYGRMIFEKIRK